MKRYVEVPAELAERYPDIAICEIEQDGIIAPLLTTNDRTERKKGRCAFWTTSDGGMNCGTVIDERGGLVVVDGINGELLEVPAASIVGTAIGIITKRGIVLDPEL